MRRLAGKIIHTYSRLSPRSRLLLILALGLVLRLAWLVLAWDDRLILDEPEYLAIARAIRAGGYLDDGRWLRPPLYPLWLALTLGTGESLLLARLAQILPGLALIVLLSYVALEIWQHRGVAELAGLLAAIYFPLIAYSYYLMADMLLLVWLAALLLVLVRMVRLPSWKLAALAGVFLGLALLTKPVAQACVPVVVVAVCLATGGAWKKRLGWLLLAGLCSMVVVAPWTVRNALVHQRFILLDTTGGFNLWFDNRLPGQGGALFEERMNRAYPNLADRNRAYTSLAWQNVRENPGYTAGQLLARARLFWRTQADVLATQQYGDLVLTCPGKYSFPGIVDEGEHFGQFHRQCWWKWLNLADDLVYLPMLAGLVVVFLLLRPSGAVLATGGVWLLAFFLTIIVTQAQTRLRLPIVPVFLPFAAAGVAKLLAWGKHYVIIDRISRNVVWHKLAHHWRVQGAFLVFLVGAWGLSLVPLGLSLVLAYPGAWLWRSGNPEQALTWYRAAVACYPTRMSMLLAAGQVAETLHDDDEARSYYQAATEVVSYEPQARIGIARLLQRHGDLDGASDVLQGSSLSSRQLDQVGFAAPLLPTQHYLDIGGAAAAEHGYVLGFYPADTVENAPTFRWSRAQATIRFGTLPTPAGVVRLRLSATRPDGVSSPRLTFLVNGTFMTQTIVTPGWWRTYRFVVPPSPHGVVLTIQTETFVLPDKNRADAERRNLGVAVDWAAFDPFFEGIPP